MHPAPRRTAAPQLLAACLLLAGCSANEAINPLELGLGPDGGAADAADADSSVAPDGKPEVGADSAGPDAKVADGAIDASHDAGAEAALDVAAEPHQELDATGSEPAAEGGSPADADASGEGGLQDASDEQAAEDSSSGDDAGLDAAEDGAGQDAEAGAEAGAGLALRVVAANLTSGNYQAYDPGEGIRILKGLTPDLVLIQEFNYGTNAPSQLQAMTDGILGPGSYYYREDGQIPNGILSRYPILQSGEWDDPSVANRDFAWARIDLPGDRDLWAVSVHFLTTSATERAKEAQALVGYLASNVPSDAWLVVGGDFNTDVRAETCITNLSARVWTEGPWPVDQADNGNTNRARTKPYDWLLASDSLDALQIPVVIGTQAFSYGLVFDSRVFTPLSDVPPVLASDSNATDMQHMAVVRTFLVP